MCALFVTRTANAATVVVTNTLDRGPGSLRQAVLDAHDGDVVTFSRAAFSAPVTITLTSGRIPISHSISIRGDVGRIVTPTISGDYTSTLFAVPAGARVSL